ncbi:MAG: hypothetical protein LBS83_01075 [Holosporales bacterium]|jgi:ribose-phosphate pyrophosphokinase|nr:hypothetical protein [Holosporales bacterium]
MIFLTGKKSDLLYSIIKLCETRNIDCVYVEHEYHPDGEIFWKLPKERKKKVLLQLPYEMPNDGIVGALALGRQLSFETICMPYMPYSREKALYDIFLQKIGKKMITCDFHEFFAGNVNNISLAEIFSGCDFKEFISKKTFVLAPDEGARHRAALFARKLGLNTFTAIKKRRKNECIISLPEKIDDYKQCIIVDDMISSGQTIWAAIKEIQEMGISEIVVIVTHVLAESQTEVFYKIMENIKILFTTNIHNILFKNKIKIIDISSILINYLQ